MHIVNFLSKMMAAMVNSIENSLCIHMKGNLKANFNALMIFKKDFNSDLAQIIFRN